MTRAVRAFVQGEVIGGIFLLLAGTIAIWWANSALLPSYDDWVQAPVTVGFGDTLFRTSTLHIINDGLMVAFFLLVGLEIKRELLEGELASFRRAVFPFVAAIGGMVVPALIYVVINLGEDTLAGWAIPSATDIAFSLGVLAMLGKRIPASLKIFLLTLAVIDDLGAVIIIGLFYSSGVSLFWLAATGGAILLLSALNATGVTRILPYLAVGIIVWICVLKSGMHATIAGVLTALAIPLRGSHPDGPSPLRDLIRTLHPWTTFVILPLFALYNAGVSLSGISLGFLLEPVPLGIAAGLFLGKQAGVFAGALAVDRLGIGQKPRGTSWLQIYGVSVVTGIGFTMSLFIGNLAFPGHPQGDAVRTGVILGSLSSFLLGAFVLAMAKPGTEHRPQGQSPDS